MVKKRFHVGGCYPSEVINSHLIGSALGTWLIPPFFGMENFIHTKRLICVIFFIRSCLLMLPDTLEYFTGAFFFICANARRIMSLKKSKRVKFVFTLTSVVKLHSQIDLKFEFCEKNNQQGHSKPSEWNQNTLSSSGISFNVKK